jgi:hypothetical protein
VGLQYLFEELIVTYIRHISLKEEDDKKEGIPPM